MKVKNYLSKLSLVASVSMALTSCSPKAGTTPQVSSSFKMTGSSAAATVAKMEHQNIWSLLMNKAYALMPSSLVDSTGFSITLSEAWIVVKEIEFKSEETAGIEDSEIEIEFQGPYVVDLLSNTPLTLDTQLIAQKAIRRIKMKLHKAETLPIGSPAGLINNSIYISGVVGGNNFTLQLDDSTEIQIAGPNGFEPSENSELMVEIQLANILKQINMSSVTNGEVISSAARHPGANLCDSIDLSAGDIYTCMRKGLEKHANFGSDVDGDDDLDSADSDVK